MNSQEMPPIRNHVELSYRIMKLHALKAEQEEILRKDIKEIYYSFHPSELMRSMWQNFKQNPEAQQNAGKAGLGLGLDFLVRRLTGRTSSVKGYLTSVLFEKLTTYFLNKHSDTIVKGVSKLGKMFKQAA